MVFHLHPPSVGPFPSPSSSTDKTLGTNLFSPEHIHRKNCLKNYGVKVTVQKLEKIDNFRLQDMWVVTIRVDCACSANILCVLVWDNQSVFLYETHCWLSVALVSLFSHTEWRTYWTIFHLWVLYSYSSNIFIVSHIICKLITMMIYSQ